jgi:hypothetical protein
VLGNTETEFDLHSRWLFTRKSRTENKGYNSILRIFILFPVECNKWEGQLQFVVITRLIYVH